MTAGYRPKRGDTVKILALHPNDIFSGSARIIGRSGVVTCDGWREHDGYCNAVIHIDGDALPKYFFGVRTELIKKGKPK